MENIVITEQGKQLMSKVISETESMTFTKIAVSDYDYSGIELQNISELQSVKQTAIISKTSRTDGKTVEILAAINNEQIPESYYVRTLGVYVKDSSENEILYGISISGENPDYMPAYEGKTLSGVSYRINVAVEDSEYITVNVNPAAVPTIMQVEDIDTAFREHMEDKVSHITAAERKKWDAVTEKVNKEEGKGLSHNDFTDADKKKLDGIAAGANKTIVDNELNSYSSNPVQNQVVYEEMLKRMAQKWVGSHLYTLYGIVVPSTVNGANTGSHYLDVKTGNTYIMTGYTDRGTQAWTNTGTLQSVEEILNSKFDKSNIANNLVTTEKGYVADARQLNKSVENSFAYEMDKSISAINNSLSKNLNRNYQVILPATKIGKSQYHRVNFPNINVDGTMLYCRIIDNNHCQYNLMDMGDFLILPLFRDTSKYGWRILVDSDGSYVSIYYDATNKQIIVYSSYDDAEVGLWAFNWKF